MKQYTFKVIVTEQNDEFWEELEAKKESGCTEITLAVSDALDDTNFDYILKLEKYTDA